MCFTGISFGRSKLLQSCSNLTLKPELEPTVIACFCCLAIRDAQEVLYTRFVQTLRVVSETKTEARGTQISKTKHLSLETCLSFKSTRETLYKSPNKNANATGIKHDNE